MIWIIAGIIIYLLIGVGLLIWIVKTDPWGGMVLEIWWLFILIYPVYIVHSWIAR